MSVSSATEPTLFGTSVRKPIGTETEMLSWEPEPKIFGIDPALNSNKCVSRFTGNIRSPTCPHVGNLHNFSDRNTKNEIL